ncbi:hypothetical protein HK101_003881 [Irineochytrium annulatum]|nr:hypothetical protein HK101_003881 [Irineochytrium annulatum]
MSLVTTKLPVHKHVPLIRFIGPRSHQRPQHHEEHHDRHSDEIAGSSGTARPQQPVDGAPNGSVPRGSSSPGVTRVVYYDAATDVPGNFRSRSLSQQEIDLILGGGVKWEEPVKKKK